MITNRLDDNGDRAAQLPRWQRIRFVAPSAFAGQLGTIWRPVPYAAVEAYEILLDAPDQPANPDGRHVVSARGNFVLVQDEHQTERRQRAHWEAPHVA